ncbi:MAG: class III poly(R)-hydroxyalkanoic acid synthase subunit PhaE [Lysobacterales bacterium]|jgi:class III poly(R)-hydroxyalkanoic acid synthase PhaE subunit|nr:MAG: class III poly(R)-hydroxyalkanoic acid synthase subunit PhaE [Xanthomonadales bacterium]
MSEAKDSGDWLEEWKALQARFWESFGRLASANAETGTAAPERGDQRPGAGLPWHEGLELWTRLFRPREEVGATVEHALARARQLLAWMQRAAERAAGNGGALPSGEDLAQLMRDFAYAALPDPFAWFSAWSVDRLRELERFWQPLASLAGGAWDSQRAEWERWLDVQPFGLLREHQERRQAMARASIALAEAEARYRALLGRALQRGIERFEEKLAERGENGSPVRSARELFDLWMDAGEEGFQEVASAPEFRTVYGQLVNAQMRLRRLLQTELEILCRALGMPTRAELDGVLRKLKALRESRAELEARVAALEAAKPAPASERQTAETARSARRAPRTSPAKSRPASRRKES